MIFLITALIRCLVDGLQLCILVRAIMSWFPGSDNNALGNFIYTVTEPIVGFVRSILYKSKTMSRLPIDLSLWISCILLGIVSMFL